jgi:hypothetical protein
MIRPEMEAPPNPAKSLIAFILRAKGPRPARKDSGQRAVPACGSAVAADCHYPLGICHVTKIGLRVSCGRALREHCANRRARRWPALRVTAATGGGAGGLLESERKDALIYFSRAEKQMWTREGF